MGRLIDRRTGNKCWAYVELYDKGETYMAYRYYLMGFNGKNKKHLGDYSTLQSAKVRMEAIANA